MGRPSSSTARTKAAVPASCRRSRATSCWWRPTTSPKPRPCSPSPSSNTNRKSKPVFDPGFILAGVLNGLLAGGIYVLVAVGLTLIYGVLHIINFAHGSLLMLAMYAVFFLWRLLGVDPYVALPLVIGGAFVFGFVLYRLLIGRFSHGKDENILLITLGVSIVADNASLLFVAGDT